MCRCCSCCHSYSCRGPRGCFKGAPCHSGPVTVIVLALLLGAESPLAELSWHPKPRSVRAMPHAVRGRSVRAMLHAVRRRSVRAMLHAVRRLLCHQGYKPRSVRAMLHAVRGRSVRAKLHAVRWRSVRAMLHADRRLHNEYASAQSVSATCHLCYKPTKNSLVDCAVAVLAHTFLCCSA